MRGDQLKILICDDEQQYLDVLSAHISEYMHNRFIEASITATTSPRDVLQANQSFDLAFLDIQMSGMDGISLAKMLRERNRKLTLFLLQTMMSIRTTQWICRRFVF